MTITPEQLRSIEWANFLADWVDYNHGKGESDRAWEEFQQQNPEPAALTPTPEPAPTFEELLKRAAAAHGVPGNIDEWARRIAVESCMPEAAPDAPIIARLIAQCREERGRTRNSWTVGETCRQDPQREYERWCPARQAAQALEGR